MVYWTEEDFKEIYGRYQESGLSIREFCSTECILEGRYHYWKRKMDRGNGSPQFVPMKLEKPHHIRTAENGRYPPTENGDIRSLFRLF